MVNKLILWKLGLLREDKCPVCGKFLKRTGFVNEIGGQHYLCLDEGCGFNEN